MRQRASYILPLALLALSGCADGQTRQDSTALNTPSGMTAKITELYKLILATDKSEGANFIADGIYIDPVQGTVNSVRASAVAGKRLVFSDWETRKSSFGKGPIVISMKGKPFKAGNATIRLTVIKPGDHKIISESEYKKAPGSGIDLNIHTYGAATSTFYIPPSLLYTEEHGLHKSVVDGSFTAIQTEKMSLNDCEVSGAKSVEKLILRDSEISTFYSSETTQKRMKNVISNLNLKALITTQPQRGSGPLA